MLECKACALRSLRAIVANTCSPRSHASTPLLLTPHLLVSRAFRKNLTIAANKSEVHRNTANDALFTDSLSPQDATLKEAPTKHGVTNERALRAELLHLKDPVKFANHVHYTLRCNKPEKALDLCRVASKSMNCVVAWNHTVNWLMKAGRINEAIKVYNEMKKRAQYPDSYTYLLLLRGFPQHRTHHAQRVKSEMVAKAVSIYNSMSSPTSKVKPAIMHTNAVLRVCSLARDMDALWGIVSQLPEHGPDSADCITYTILLSAIRHAAHSEEPGLSPEVISKTRQDAVDEGRRIWQDVVKQWRSGQLLIDEELVCEMGNLLLISKRLEDWDDVLNLVQQTTNIKRLLAPLGSPDRHTEHIPRRNPDLEQGEANEHVEETSGWTPTPSANAFKPVDLRGAEAGNSQRPASFGWVKPGNAVLSVIMDACTAMRASKAVTAYWDLFVQEHGVTPDRANYQALLRQLRINRNSAKAAMVIQDMQKHNVELRNQTFRLATSVCLRNPKNPNVLSHAETIVDVMRQSQEEPDIPTLQNYVELATKVESGQKLSDLVNKLLPTIDSLKSRVTLGAETSLSENNTTVLFFQSVIGALDKLGRNESVSREDAERWRSQRSELDSLIGQATNNAAHQRQVKGRRDIALRQYTVAKHTLRQRNAQLVALNKRQR